MNKTAKLDPVLMIPVGFVSSSRKERKDDHWDVETTSIVLDETRFTGEALQGLDGFSHIEVIFLLHSLDPNEAFTGTRHPRGRADLPRVGVFAQRGGTRPNRIGLACCQIQRIQGLTMEVSGLDAIDGTPILDIKPYFQEFGPRGSLKQPTWVKELMKEYWEITP